MSSSVNLPNFSTQIPSVANAPTETIGSNLSQNMLSVLLLLQQMNPNFFKRSGKDKYEGLEDFAKVHAEEEEKTKKDVEKFMNKFKTSSAEKIFRPVPPTGMPVFPPLANKPLTKEDLLKQLEEQKKIIEKTKPINKKEMYKIRKAVTEDPDYYKKKGAKEKLSFLEKKLKELEEENNTETEERAEAKPVGWWQTFLSGLGIR